MSVVVWIIGYMIYLGGALGAGRALFEFARRHHGQYTRGERLIICIALSLFWPAILVAVKVEEWMQI